MTSDHPFYQHFSKIYGDRWPALFAALSVKEQQVARLNKWSKLDTNQKWKSLPTQSFVSDCFWLDGSVDVMPERSSDDLLDIYIMDPASVIVARALEVQAGDRVLDMCAAPGGKSLILIEANEGLAEVFCNDLSAERRERLKKVLQQYVPRSIRDNVWVTGKDGVQFGLKEPRSFDRILLDAPCSGERHVLENAKAQQEWSPRRTEHLATRQYALLAAAFLALKPGGRMVYSTCSISPPENDGVVQKLLKKKKNLIKIVETEMVGPGEKTEVGTVYLPDRCGFGPLYYSVIEKI